MNEDLWRWLFLPPPKYKATSRSLWCGQCHHYQDITSQKHGDLVRGAVSLNITSSLITFIFFIFGSLLFLIVYSQEARDRKLGREGGWHATKVSSRICCGYVVSILDYWPTVTSNRSVIFKIKCTPVFNWVIIKKLSNIKEFFINKEVGSSG